VLTLGSPAPDFTAPTSKGDTFTLSSLRGKPIVLYFYPKAFTPGCTMESKRFRDVYPDVKALGAEIVGVSHDALDTQCRFSESLGLPFVLVPDPDRKIIESYGVAWPVFKLAKRITFIVDEEFKLSSYHQHELLIGRHAEDVLAALKTMKARRNAPPRR
jgi:peroxiredoxin Q/BCP